MADDGYDIYGGAPAGGGGVAGMVAGLPTGGGYDDSAAAAGAGAAAGGGYDAGAARAPSASSVRGAMPGAQSDQGLDSAASLVMEEILEKLKMLDYEMQVRACPRKLSLLPSPSPCPRSSHCRPHPHPSLLYDAVQELPAAHAHLLRDGERQP